MNNNALKLTTPLSDETLRSLRIGTPVTLSGIIYTARDAAHKRLAETLQNGGQSPIPLVGAIIYYVGPAPARPGEISGPAGPTTTGRVDHYTPLLLAHGLQGMIGKGKRSLAVRQAMVKHGAIYFVAVGGAAALIADRIKKIEVVAYADLGTEAIHRMAIEEMPLVVGNDLHGGDLFEAGQAAYRREE